MGYSTVKKGKTGVIIPAGGSGSRMGGVYKPLEKICGKELLCRCLEVFQAEEDVAFVVISARRDKTEEIRKMCEKNSFSKVKAIIEGGADRQSSVKNAFNCGLFDDDGVEYLAVHDAARPLLTAKTLKNVLEAAYEHSAAVCAARVRDTVKRSGEDQIASESVDRNGLWLIQTPQVFDKRLYAAALEAAEKRNFVATDDSSLLTEYGVGVYLCESPFSNIKLTYPDDVYLAEAIIKYENGEIEK